MSARFGWMALAFLMGVASPAAAQCPNNGGGPRELQLVLDEREAWDLDIGASGILHNLEVTGTGRRDARLGVCLSGCDATSDSTCDIGGTLQLQDKGAFAGLVVPPIPVSTNGVVVCVAIGVPSPRPAVTGDVDVATGSFAFSTTLNVALWPSLPGAPCPQCVRGRCDSGPLEDQRCDVDAVVTLGTSGQQRLEVSRDCPPPVATSLRLPVSIRNRDYVGGVCPNESNYGSCLGSCNTTGCTAPATGEAQQCCSAQPTRGCFFNNASSQFVRAGTVAKPLPAYPDPQYPKSTTGNGIVAGGCLSATGTLTLDGSIGLPGPAAMILPVSLTLVRSESDATTTSTVPGEGATTTTVPGGGTTTTTLPASCEAVSCDDGNACTDDACGVSGCANVLRPGVAGLRCQIARLRTGQPCGADPVSGKFAKQLDKALGKADRLLSKVDAATGKKRAKLLKKVGSALRGGSSKVGGALKKKTVTPACGAVLNEGIGEITVGAQGLGS